MRLTSAVINVRFGSEADILYADLYVRFATNNGHKSVECLLSG